MDEIVWARVFGYSVLPLLLAAGHVVLARRTMNPHRRVEVFTMYVLAIGVGAAGLGGAFGHLFLSDVVAESIGWATGSPFQLEMGVANLALGVLGLVAVTRRDAFRAATILAVVVVGIGVTGVHLWDITETGNLAPGNTVQNGANLLDPIMLVGLALLSRRYVATEASDAAFHWWFHRQQPILSLAAVGVGTGFGIGYSLDLPFVATVLGALAGVTIGWLISRQIPRFRVEASQARTARRPVAYPR